MNLKISNNAVARLAAPITAGQTSFSLQAGQGAKFPTLGEGDYFTLTAVRPDTSLEIMYVTARTFDVLTVLRGQENTLALAFDALTIVENRITAKSIMDEIHLNRSMVNAALQAFQPSVPIGIDQLRVLLLNALTPAQLTEEFRNRIALIDGNSALAGSVSQRVKNATDAFIAGLTQEATDRTTYVQQYAFSKQGTTAAISAQASATQAAYTAYADAARQSAIATSQAYANSYTYSAADIRAAITASENTLRAEFSGGGSGGPSYATQAYVQNYAYSVAQADGAIAAQTADLRTTVGLNTAAISQSATTLNGLSAQVYTKIDVNGYITGYGLASTGATSAFVVRAERFMFVGPDNNPQPLFNIVSVGGQARAVLRGTLAIGGSPDSIMPDPSFRDLAWWGRAGALVDDYSATNTQWKAGAALTIDVAHGNVLETLTQTFPMTPGATYLVEFQTFMTNDFVGAASVLWLIPNVQWHLMGGPSLPYAWSDGLPEMFNTDSPKGFRTFSATYIVPNNGYTSKTQIQLKTRCTAGAFQIGGISITRVSDSTLIGEGSVGTRQLTIYTGGAINSGQSGFDLGNGFWLEGEGQGHGARMSIGRQSGRKIIIDPANNRLELVDPQLTSPMTVSVAPAFYNIVRNANQQFNDAYAGNFTATVANAGTNLAYQWSVSSENSAVTANMSSPTGSQCIITVSGKLFSDQEVNVGVYCVVTDLDTRVSRPASASINVQTQSF